MEGKGLQALLCVLVIVGCSLAFAPAVSPAVPADPGPGAIAQVDAIQDQDQDQEQDQDQNQTREQNRTDEEQSADQDPNQTQNGSDRLNTADEIHIDVFVHENGSATFVVDYRFENGSSSDWEDLRDDVQENAEMYVSDEMDAWNDTLEDAENATDREMELSNASIRTDTSSAPQDLGHVIVSFEWSSFAYVELNRIEVGDVLAGFVLPQNTTMQVFPPEGYVISDEESSPDDPAEESVFWHGESTDFAADPPSIVMIENGNATAGEPADESSEESPSMPWLVVLGALALLATVGAAGWWVRDRGILGPTAESNGDAPPAPTATDGAESPDGSGATAAPDGPPPELLSNEERVLRLLEQRGGRIKQQEVVSELDWTEAKTSQVVSGLREDDEIDVFRIGRENVLSLPDEAEPGSGTGTGTGTGTENGSATTGAEAGSDSDPSSGPGSGTGAGTDE